MKLHLPKAVFAAVMSLFAVSQTVWAGAWGDFADGTGNAYYTSAGEQGDLNMTTAATTVTTQYITPGSGVTTSTIGTITLDHKDIIIVSGTGTDNFTLLTIGSIAVPEANTGDGATTHTQLKVTQNQHVQLNGSSGSLSLNVDSAGSLTLSGTHERLNAYYGQATIASGSVTITTLDAGMGGSARGGVLVKSGASLTISTLYNHVNNNTNKAVILEKDASLALSGVTIKGISSDSATYATVHRHNAGGGYSATDGNYTISNAQVEYNGTIGNKLTNVVLNSDTASHILTVNNAANTINKVTASAGAINVQNAVSVGTVELSGGVVTVSGATTTLGAVAMTGGEMNVSNMTIGNTTSLSLTGGSMNISGTSTVDNITLDAGDGTLTISDSTIKGSITSNGNLVLSSGITGVSAELSGSGNISIGKTLSGSIKLTGGTIMLDADFNNYEVKNPGTVTYSLENENGFKSLSNASYWLIQGDATGTTVTSAGYGVDKNMTLESDGTGVWFEYAEAVASKEFYVTTGDVTVTSAMQAQADTYVLNGATGRMVLEEGNVSANDIVINNIGNGISLGSNATITDISAADDTTLLAGISGTGTIEVTSRTGTANTDWGTAIAPGENFTGTLYVKTGKFTLDTSNIGKTLKLGSGAHFQMNAACTLASDQEIILTGTHEFHINTNAPNDDSFTISGTISGDGTLVRKGNASKEVNITGNASVTGFQNTVGTLNVVDNSTVTKLTVSGGTTNIANESSVKTLAVSGGTVDINTTGSMGNLHLTGGETIITGNLSIGKSSDAVNRQTGIYAQHTGTLNIGDGTTVTKVIATRLESGDANPNDTTQTGGIINVADKASLVITAHEDKLGNTGNYQVHGLMLGAWGSPNTPLGQASTLNVSGDFLAQNIQAAAGDSTAIVNIESGGKVAVKGITSSVRNKSDVQLNLKDGGTLILGENGIHDLKNLTGSFAAGTVGISADASIAENISLCSETGTTFDTTKYVWSTDGTSIEKGTEGGMLTISGVISDHSVTTTTGEGDAATSTTTTYNGKLVKDGLGTLTLQGANTYTGGTEVKAGMLIASTGAGLSSGGVTVKGGSVEVTNAGGGAKVVVGKSGSADATFVYNGAGSASGGTGTTYSVGNAAYSINNAAVEVSNENGTTISNRLQGVALSNTGTGLLTAGNGYNNLTEIIAETGDINLTWFAEQAKQGTVTNLTIGEGRTVGVYAGHAADGVEKDITVSSLTAGSGAKLNANLILTTGASLTLDGALAMGSTLTLGTALTLDETTLQAIMGLSAGEKHALFTGVDALTLNGTTYNMGTVLDSTDGHDLGTYFVLADAGTPAVLSDTTAASGYYLGYTAEGMVYAGKVIPEPTTATLSLLALAALAARRRRK